MLINVFKKHFVNKMTLSDRSALCGELKVVGSGPKVINMHYKSIKFTISAVNECNQRQVLCCRRTDSAPNAQHAA